MISDQAKSWAVPEENKPPEQFWIDFGNFVMASKNYDDSDHYWSTLVDWADVLMKRYQANEIVCHVVIDYIDGQSKRSKQRQTA